MDTPQPPDGYQSWLEYAIATMDVRGAHLDGLLNGDEAPSHDAIREAAQAELNQLQQKSAMPWIGMLERWQIDLSNRLGRSAEDIIEGNLWATDFSSDSVNIQFEDGSDLTFRRAFYLGDTPDDGSIHRVAVFTEHCGYHEFWIGPGDQISISAK